MEAVGINTPEELALVEDVMAATAGSAPQTRDR